jgi:hypothetical protein
MTWNAVDVTFEIDADATFEQVITVVIGTPQGRIFVMAEPREEGRTLILDGFNIHSDAGAGVIGRANLKMLAQFVMERMDYDELVVQGTSRTSGAGPGRVPGKLRFSRSHIPASDHRP